MSSFLLKNSNYDLSEYVRQIYHPAVVGAFFECPSANEVRPYRGVGQTSVVTKAANRTIFAPIEALTPCGKNIILQSKIHRRFKT